MVLQIEYSLLKCLGTVVFQILLESEIVACNLVVEDPESENLKSEILQ